MRDRSAQLLRAAQKLAQARRVVQGERKIDYDAMATNWPAFIASLPPEDRARVRPESLTETVPRDPSTIVCPITEKLRAIEAKYKAEAQIPQSPSSGFVSVLPPVGDPT